MMIHLSLYILRSNKAVKKHLTALLLSVLELQGDEFSAHLALRKIITYEN
jgi:hypothetical protein